MLAAGTQGNPSPRAITVVLADDHNIVREGLRLLLEAAGDIEVIGEAEDGLKAVERVRELRPDVAVLDLAMPCLNGKEAARQILQFAGGTKVLVLSSYAEDQTVQELIQLGVMGYVVKHAAATDIIKAVRDAKQGIRFFSPSISRRLSAQAQQAIAAHGHAKEGPAKVKLTPREAQVLQLIAEGHPNKRIASILAISIKTVEKHRQQVMNKLNLHDVAGLTRHAIAHGIVESQGGPVHSGL